MLELFSWDKLHPTVLFSWLRQSLWLPAPPLTEENLGSLAGQVCLVTGGNSGVGRELCRMLYGAGARVFLAGRRQDACEEAIEWIKDKEQGSAGSLEYLHVDLGNLESTKRSANEFLARSDRLDFLSNNAGVMHPPAGSLGSQGHELQVVTNCLSPYLLTELLTPLLIKTAAAERAEGRSNTVRVAWASSMAADLTSPGSTIVFAKDKHGNDEQKVLGPFLDYGQSKAGNLLIAKAWGEKVKADGVVSVSFNPGNLNTNLMRYATGMEPNAFFRFLKSLILHPAVFGAYTQLYCGFSQDLTTADNGCFIGPWGRKWHLRPGIEAARTGDTCKRYMAYVEREVASYR